MVRFTSQQPVTFLNISPGEVCLGFVMIFLNGTKEKTTVDFSVSYSGHSTHCFFTRHKVCGVLCNDCFCCSLACLVDTTPLQEV